MQIVLEEHDIRAFDCGDVYIELAYLRWIKQRSSVYLATRRLSSFWRWKVCRSALVRQVGRAFDAWINMIDPSKKEPCKQALSSSSFHHEHDEQGINYSTISKRLRRSEKCLMQ